jgi:hypothetical protein
LKDDVVTKLFTVTDIVAIPALRTAVILEPLKFNCVELPNRTPSSDIGNETDAVRPVIFEPSPINADADINDDAEIEVNWFAAVKSLLTAVRAKLPVSKLSTKVSIIFPLYDLSISGVIACVLLSANDALLSACNCAFVSIAIYGFYSF